MPQTAPFKRNKLLRKTQSGIPRGYSADNSLLIDCVMASLRGFYGSSEVLVYYDYQFPFDDATIVERIVREALKATLTQLQDLLAWEADWNSYDALPPNRDAVLRAEDWIVRLFLEVAALGRVWISPNVTASADGEVVFEWWYGRKKLTVYVSDESTEYVQVWGDDMDTEMSEGNADPLSTCRSLWLWLVG